MVTQILFFMVLLAIAVQRLFELRKSNKHVKALLARGGIEHASRHFIAMVSVHFFWFVAMLAEVYFFEREFYWPFFVIGAILTLAGNTLRFLSMRELGPRWTVRIISLPGSKLVDTGVYRYLRHPIYVGVVMEIAGVPLLHSAYLTCILFTILNALVLRVRIHEEEKALL